ncbi:MAG: nucleotide-binding domain containing protein, partial [Spirochaetia bacterium]|nr:nucleotide-binding domain containing protein [Spirochaetia bacterium]
LTPMWDSDLNNLIAAQGKYRSFNLDYSLLEKNRVENYEKIFNYKSSIGNNPFYIITDYFKDKHGEIIADLFRDLPFLTGGSGLPYHLARQHSSQHETSIKKEKNPGAKGRTLILAGSCSMATRAQIERYKKDGGISVEIDPAGILESKTDSSYYSDFIIKNTGADVLIHTPSKILNNGTHDFSSILENTLAEIAYNAVKDGIKKIIVAGGETSGAVAGKLGFDTYLIAGSVAPGVPVLIPVERDDMRVVYKSGNFGQENFFIRAIAAAAE